MKEQGLKYLNNLKRCFRNIKQWFKRLFKKKINNEPEIEKITDQLIVETISDNGVLSKELNVKLQNYDTDNNPLGLNEAKSILNSLITLAITQRSLLAQRIAKSIEQGNLYDDYYEKMNDINKLTIAVDVEAKRLERINNEYNTQNHIYNKVTGMTYERAVLPDDSDVNNGQQVTR